MITKVTGFQDMKKEDISDKIKKAYQEIVNKYTNVVIKVKSTYYDIHGNVRTKDYPDIHKYMYRNLEGLGYSIHEYSKGQIHSVFAKNTQYAFILEITDNNRLALVSLIQNKTDPAKYKSSRVVFENDNNPYTCATGNLLKKLQSPKFEILSIQARQIDSNTSALVIKYRQTWNNPDGEELGEITTLPDNHYAVLDHECTLIPKNEPGSQSRRSIKSTYAYNPIIDMQSLVRQEYLLRGNPGYVHAIYELEYEKDLGSAREYLRSFGLPEPVDYTSEGDKPFELVLILALFVLAGSFAAIFYLRRRSLHAVM